MIKMIAAKDLNSNLSTQNQLRNHLPNRNFILELIAPLGTKKYRRKAQEILEVILKRLFWNFIRIKPRKKTFLGKIISSNKMEATLKIIQYLIIKVRKASLKIIICRVIVLIIQKVLDYHEAIRIMSRIIILIIMTTRVLIFQIATVKNREFIIVIKIRQELQTQKIIKNRIVEIIIMEITKMMLAWEMEIILLMQRKREATQGIEEIKQEMEAKVEKMEARE